MLRCCLAHLILIAHCHFIKMTTATTTKYKAQGTPLCAASCFSYLGCVVNIPDRGVCTSRGWPVPQQISGCKRTTPHSLSLESSFIHLFPERRRSYLEQRYRGLVQYILSSGSMGRVSIETTNDWLTMSTRTVTPRTQR